MTKSKREPYALPTPELTAKGQFKEEAMNAAPGAPKRLRRMDSSELDRLLFAGDIAPDEHSTLELFRKDLTEAGMIFLPKASLMPGSTSGHAQFIGDTAFRRAKLVSEQMTALRNGLPKPGWTVLMNALMSDTKVEKAFMPHMHHAATILEDFYRKR